MDVQAGTAKATAARKRVPNFTADEKGLLASMVKKRRIVECKQTDGKSVEKKKLAWDSITTEFNSHNNVCKRDTLTLKRAWDNMKAVTRKARAAERGNLIKTGGGPSIPPQPPQQGAIINMVEDATPAIVCEVSNSYDSDGAILSQIDQADINSNMMVDDLEITMWEEQDKAPEKESQDVYADDIADDIAERDIAVSVEHSTRKPIDYVRREAVMRIKHFETKKKMEMRTLKVKLEVQEIKKEQLSLKRKFKKEKQEQLSLKRKQTKLI